MTRAHARASCFAGPYVYGFDGHAWHYETSLGGATLIGHARQLQAGAGKPVRFLPLAIRLDGARILDERSVELELLAAEDHIVYLDHAQLLAVHHPPGHELVSSSAMQWRSLRQRDPRRLWAFASADCRAPVHASLCGQLDQREALSQQSETPAAYALDRHNFYELDFGEVRDARRAWLLLDGWKFKRERGLPLIAQGREPMLEIRQRDGSWRHARALAAPRGDRKTIAVDLSALRWPTGAYQLRLWTGTNEGGYAMWYLDRARLVEATPAPVSVAKLAPRRAQLDFRGPPTLLAPDDHPRLSLNDGGGQREHEPQTHGRFTRYGDVTALVRAPDERLVVMREGDCVSLRFEHLPVSPPGLETTVFLHTNLVHKLRVVPGADGPTPLTETVEPLPRRRMGRYDQHAVAHAHPEHQRYLARWNTREHPPNTRPALALVAEI